MKSSIWFPPVYVVAFVVLAIFVAWIFSMSAVLAQDETPTPVPQEVDTFTLTINGKLITKDELGLFPVEREGELVARVQFKPENAANDNGTFDNGTTLTIFVIREIATRSDHQTTIFVDGENYPGNPLDATRFIEEFVMTKNREIDIKIDPRSPSGVGSSASSVPIDVPTLTPPPPTQTRLSINGVELTQYHLSDFEVGVGWVFKIENGRVGVSRQPNEEGGFDLGEPLRIEPVAEDDGFIINTPDKAACSLDCAFEIIMNQDENLTILIKPIPPSQAEGIPKPIPPSQAEGIPKPIPPSQAEGIQQELVFKVTIQNESLKDFIEGLEESTEADDIELLSGGLMLWVEMEGFSSKKINTESDRREEYNLVVPIPFRKMFDPNEMTFHLGVLTKIENITPSKKKSFTLVFDVDGRDDPGLLLMSLLVETNTPNDQLLTVILGQKKWIFIGLFIVFYGTSLLISRKIQSMSSTAINFFLPSNRLETKGMNDKLNQIQYTIGSGNYSSQRDTSSPMQSSETLDVLKREVRGLSDQIQKHSGTIYDLHQRINQELDVNAASKNEEALLPDADRDRQQLSASVTSLGESLRNSVAEIVAQRELVNPGEYWAVQDRRHLLSSISVHLVEQEERRRGNLEHISDTIRQLRSLNVRQNLENIEALSKPDVAGFENSETIAAILDDMLASVSRRPISPQIIEKIDAFSSHVEGLGITSRFIPAALVEICRELVANSSPEEVDQIEIIISRVIESARNRF